MTLDPLNCNWVSTSTTNIYNISRSYSRNETLRGIYTCTKRMINTTKTLYCRSEKYIRIKCVHILIVSLWQCYLPQRLQILPMLISSRTWAWGNSRIGCFTLPSGVLYWSRFDVNIHFAPMILISHTINFTIECISKKDEKKVAMNFFLWYKDQEDVVTKVKKIRTNSLENDIDKERKAPLKTWPALANLNLQDEQY